MKLDLNLNKERAKGDPMKTLIDTYLEMKAESDMWKKLSGGKSTRRSSEAKSACIERVSNLSLKSSVAAACLPEITRGEGFLLLHGCQASMNDGRLSYEIVPVIYDDNGNGNVSRGIDLFTPEIGVVYDDSKTWRENVQRVLDKHAENEKVLMVFYSDEPEMLSEQRLLVKACEKIRDEDPELIKARFVKTDSIVNEAERIRIERIKKNSYSLLKPGGPSVREMIMMEKAIPKRQEEGLGM